MVFELESHVDIWYAFLFYLRWGKWVFWEDLWSDWNDARRVWGMIAWDRSEPWRRFFIIKMVCVWAETGGVPKVRVGSKCLRPNFISRLPRGSSYFSWAHVSLHDSSGDPHPLKWGGRLFLFPHNSPSSSSSVSTVSLPSLYHRLIIAQLQKKMSFGLLYLSIDSSLISSTSIQKREMFWNHILAPKDSAMIPETWILLQLVVLASRLLLPNLQSVYIFFNLKCWWKIGIRNRLLNTIPNSKSHLKTWNSMINLLPAMIIRWWATIPHSALSPRWTLAPLFPTHSILSIVQLTWKIKPFFLLHLVCLPKQFELFWWGKWLCNMDWQYEMESRYHSSMEEMARKIWEWWEETCGDEEGILSLKSNSPSIHPWCWNKSGLHRHLQSDHNRVVLYVISILKITDGRNKSEVSAAAGEALVAAMGAEVPPEFIDVASGLPNG